jgi:hypothetical protein
MVDLTVPRFRMFLRATALFSVSALVASFAVISAHAAAPVWQGPDGGDFLDANNWTIQLPGAADTPVINNEFEGTIKFSNSIQVNDFYLRSTEGKVILDVDSNAAGNKFTMTRYIIVGASFGEQNHAVFKSGEIENGIILVGNAAGADNNTLEVTGEDTYWKATGGSGGTAAIRVGSNGGLNSSLLVNGGAHVESLTQTIIGLQGASNNVIEVRGPGSQYSNAQSISLGDNIAADKPEQTNNQLKVLDGGFVTTRELIMGTTLRSPNNTVTVSGAGSRLTIRGGQQFPPTEGGQKHDIGRAAPNNSLIIENGGVVDGNAIIHLGREVTSVNNLVSITDGSLFGWGVEIKQGKVLIERSSLDITRKLDAIVTRWLGGSLLAQTPQALVEFRSGTLSTVNATVANGSVFTVGDGSATPAKYFMKINPQTNSNDVHSFANGFVLASNGILAGNGNVTGNVSGAVGAQVDVGASAGVINVTGSFNSIGIDVALELDNIAASTMPGVQFDQFNVSAAFTHGGSVTIDLAQLVAPASPTPLKLIGWGSEVGTRSSTDVLFVNGAAQPYTFQADGLYVTAQLSAAGLAGDYNDDGKIDAADYTVWRDRLGAATLINRAEGITGPVGASDYNYWKVHFGEGVGGGTAAWTAIPEPSAACLLLTITIVAANVRRRSRWDSPSIAKMDNSMDDRFKSLSPTWKKSVREAKL